MTRFERFIGPLIAKEGGYDDHTVKGDRGGRTFAGISMRAHPNWPGWAMLDGGHPFEEIQQSTHDLYRRLYWDRIRADDLEHDDVVEILFSSAVLSGPRTCIRLAQLAAGAKPDGQMGPKSIAAINAMNPDLFEALFALMRINRFRKIVHRDPSQRKFFFGWINRVFAEYET